MARLTGMRALAAAVVVAAPLGFAATAESATIVGVELVLAVDVSGSVDANEYALQKGGYVQAFQSAAVKSAIENTPGGIAVAYVEWSSFNQQTLQVNWTHLQTAADADAFAAAINATTRAFNGFTGIADAILFSTNQILSNDFDGARKVIDISGDGTENERTLAFLHNARDAAVAQGITINGLAIQTDFATLGAYFAANVIGGAGAFALGVDSFGDFADAVQQKLFREITGVPEPTTMALFGFGLAALGMAARRRKAA